MLELTDEMEQAFRDAWMTSMATDPRSDDPERIADRAGLAAVLAIVERENQVHPLCTATLGTGIRCEFEAGMAHPDEHSARGPNGSRIRWS